MLIHVMETSHTPWRPCILMDQIGFSCFYIGSHSDHFCQFEFSILISGFKLKGEDFPFHDKPCRMAAMYFNSLKLVLASFVLIELRFKVQVNSSQLTVC